jgi:hypothetical protein
MGCARTCLDIIEVSLTCVYRTECAKFPNRDAEAKSDAVKMISKILKTTMNLPERIQAICWVQFWAWIGRPQSSARLITISLTEIRLVSVPLLQHDMGRRSLLPLPSWYVLS